MGQAAISISLSLGCEVFTTVGSQQKIDFLMSKFPQLSRDHILYSRSAKFEEDILNMTKSRGVNVVLNSLSGDKLQVRRIYFILILLNSNVARALCILRYLSLQLCSFYVNLMRIRWPNILSY